MQCGHSPTALEKKKIGQEFSFNRAGHMALQWLRLTCFALRSLGEACPTEVPLNCRESRLSAVFFCQVVSFPFERSCMSSSGKQECLSM